MENEQNKKTFGAFINRRRKELNMTQKEFAAKLFVTDSAVSKWERGLAYPDITLLQSICEVLQISEKELLSASEDTEGRRAETLARKYLKLLRNYRVFWYLLYGLTALACGIGNLAVQHTLSWFWIVVAAELMAASVTLVPALVPEGRKGLCSLGSFTVSLLFLLLVCCIYSRGAWFLTAAASVLLGMGVIFLGPVLHALPLPENLKNLKFSIYLGTVLCLLFIQLGVICVSTGGDWYLTAVAGILLAAWLIFGAFVLRQLPLPGEWKKRKALLYFGTGLVLLLALYGVRCFADGGDWFVSASVWTVFGVSVVILPFLLAKDQIPVKPYRALTYLGFESVLLIAGMVWEGAGKAGLLSAALCLLLPWGLLGVLRYLPVGRWFRAGAGLWWTGIWVWLAPWIGDKIYVLCYHWKNQNLYSPFHIRADFSNWQDNVTCANNVLLLVLIGIFVAGAVCMAVGIWRKKTGKDNMNGI